MKIVKPLTLGILHKPYQYRRQNQFSVAALGFFRLGRDEERFLADSEQWPLVMPLLPSGQPLDEVMPKQSGEALLLGSAHAPGGKPVARMGVRLCVGAVDKCLCVVGDRDRQYTLTGRSRIGEPTPFSALPLTYARAYGGPAYAANPSGFGYTGLLTGGNGPIPNFEYPGTPVTSRWRHYRPAGFGPVNVGWAPRKQRFGSYGKRWLKEEAPGLASDVDWRLFNLAPQDQWIDGHFQGGECYRLENLHPTKPAIEGKLPTLRARAFILKSGAAPDAAIEVPLQLDTVWFLPEHELGILIYHGHTAIDDSDALDVAALMVGYEAAAAPKTLAHYRAVMALRLNPDTAALHAFSESQLAPDWLPETAVARQAQQAHSEAAALAKQQAQLDEMDADFWQQSGQTAPPGHRPPRAQAQPLDLVTPQAIAAGDFDLAGAVAKAKAMAEEVERQGQARLEELKKTMPPPAVDPQAELNGALERAAVPAYDLFPPDETGRDPQVAAMLAALAQAREAGQLGRQLANPAAYERARQGILQGPALRRQGRRASPQPTVPGLPLLPQNAQELGRVAIAWHQSGISLAGRDLAGADLRGADFTGADLRETMLESANLAGVNFAKANLQGAVLTGTILDGADFSAANLAAANLSHSRGTQLRLTDANLQAAHAISAAWPQADLCRANLDDLLGMEIDLRGANLRDVSARNTVLLQAQADDSVWHRASLNKTVAMRASLRGADFSGSTLIKVVLIEAQLQHSIWNQSNWDGVQGAGKTDFSGASLAVVKARGCGLHGAMFAAADFSAASFLRCDFGQCDLHGATLAGGLFSYSQFLQTDLRQADLRGADFFQAVCRKADLRGALLEGAALSQTEMSGALQGPLPAPTSTPTPEREAA